MYKIVKKLSFIAAIFCSLACEAQTNYTPPAGYTLVPNGALSTNNAELIAFPVGASVPAAPAASAPANSIQSFGATALQYFTTFNPALTNAFSTNQPYEAWIGASYQTGVFLGGQVGLGGQPLQGTLHGLTLRNVATLAPVVGTLADEEFDLGYSITHVDTRLTVFAGLHDDIQNHNSLQGAFGVEVQKALTDNTFAGIYLEGITHDTKNGQLIVGFETGARF